MGLSNVDLGHLVSPKTSGMDLKNGVPARGDRDSKVSDQFDHALEKSQSKNADNKANQVAKKSENLANKESQEAEPSQASKLENQNESQEVSQNEAQSSHIKKNPEMSENDKESNTDVLPESLAALQNLELAQMIKIEVSEVKGEDETASLTEIEKISGENMQANLQAVSLPEVKLTSEGLNSLQKTHENQKIEKSKIDGTDVQGEISLAGLELGLEDVDPESENNLQDLLGDQSELKTQLVAPEVNQTSEAGSRDFKSMVDSLWIEQNLKTSQPETIQFAQPAKFEVKGVESTVRTHLVDDMKPLITQAIHFKKGGEMTLSLKPQDLGWVKVEIKVDSDAVNVNIQAEQHSAKNMLEGQIHELKQQLNAAGLNLKDVSIESMKNPSAQGDRNPEFQNQQKRQHQQDAQSQFKDEPRSFSEFHMSESEGSKAA